MRRFGLFLLILSLTSFSFLSIPAASAGNVTISGVLVPGGQTMPVVAIISTPNCTGATNPVAVLYAATSFTVDTDGTYTFSEPGTSSAVYLYAGTFNPANPVVNCVAASNSNPISFSYALTAGETYVVVVTDDTYEQPGISYALSISGPGEICLGGSCALETTAGCDQFVQIPAGAVSGQFVTHALVYWMPGGATYPALIIDPGMTYLVAGQDESGQYRKILLSCDWVWVESNTVGPNWQTPWNGMPLPTTVVE